MFSSKKKRKNEVQKKLENMQKCQSFQGYPISGANVFFRRNQSQVCEWALRVDVNLRTKYGTQNQSSDCFSSLSTILEDRSHSSGARL